MRAVEYIIPVVSIMLLSSVSMLAQADRHDVRAGNREFRKENWKEADISYRKALVKDSLSMAGNYNLANTLYRQENYDEAGKTLDRLKEIAPETKYAADYHYNVGDVGIARKDWQAAVDAFRQALLLNPGDMEAKENYIYAKKMLEDQQQNGGGGGGQDNQEQQNQDGQGDQDDSQDKQDQGQDQQSQDQQNQGNDNGQDSQNRQEQNGQQPVKISPQQAQQMLKAIQAKEKQTQDKVNREKAEAMKSKQKEKNW